MRCRAAAILRELRQIDEETLAHALLPVIAHPPSDPSSHKQAAALLLEYPALRPLVAAAIDNALRQRSSTSLLSSGGQDPYLRQAAVPLVECMHRTGHLREQALDLILRCWALPNVHYPTVLRLLSHWDDPPPEHPSGDLVSEDPVAAVRARWDRRMESLAGRAQILAEQGPLEMDIRRVFAVWLAESTARIQDLCERAAAQAPPRPEDVAQIAQLVHSMPDDDVPRLLARHYFFCKLALWMGLSIEREVWTAE
jgi:hypothetical protein